MEVREGLRTDIGKGLQWLRKSLAITQYQLAALAQLDYRHYQNIETGRVEVKVETLKRICDSLGIALSGFFAITDRKPWLLEKPSRNRGNGELYVFRIEHEYARFRMYPEVRSTLNEWGHDLSEGNRESLARSPFPCFETDRSGRCLWKNPSAAQLRILPAGGIVNELFPAPLEFNSFLAALNQIFSQEHRVLYAEMHLVPANGESLRYMALIGLLSLQAKDSQSIIIACVDLPQAKETVSRAEIERPALIPVTSVPKQRLMVF